MAMNNVLLAQLMKDMKVRSVDGWIDGWMDGWVDGFRRRRYSDPLFLTPLLYPLIILFSIVFCRTPK
jgi:hypothetical protein